MSFKLTDLENLPEDVLNELKSLPKINIYKNFAQGYHRGFKSFFDYAKTFYTDESKMPSKLREIGILRIARNTKSEYETHHHTNLAKNCEVSNDECELIRSNSEVLELTEKENLVCKVADEFCTTFKISKATSEKLYSIFDTETAVEIVACLSMYIQLACILNALRVEIEEINPLAGSDKPL